MVNVVTVLDSDIPLYPLSLLSGFPSVLRIGCSFLSGSRILGSSSSLSFSILGTSPEKLGFRDEYPLHRFLQNPSVGA